MLSSARAFAVHADANSPLLQGGQKILAGELAALIRVENLGLCLLQGTVQRLDTEARIQGTYGSPDDLPDSATRSVGGCHKRAWAGTAHPADASTAGLPDFHPQEPGNTSWIGSAPVTHTDA